jgi:hypothetical protein
MSDQELKQEIDVKGMSSSHRLSATKFLQEVVDLASKGYVLHPKPVSVRQLPSFMGAPRVTMVTQERADEILGKPAPTEPTVEPKASVTISDVDPVVPTEGSTLAKLKLLHSKADLVTFANDVGIEVPEANMKKGPKSVKQYLINKLSE